ncbi:MAG: helix-turn-helix domain-containing protein [Chloroflexi bacterium]|nr:helix-turn-helix domain-containing protein [Chloroflexota bacterium]
MEKLLYRAEEVAELCSVGRTTVYAALRDGRLESVKIGASRRIPRDAVDRFVESLRAAAVATDG